jgi:diguanylate cyclase (GGDEF)-like protein
MDLFIRLDINIFAAVILLILLINARNTSDQQNRTNLIFTRMTALVLLLVLVEIVSFAVDQRPGPAMTQLNYFSNMLLYLLAPFAIGCWAEYVEHYLLRSVPDLKLRRIIRSVPVVIIVVLILINPYNHYLFRIGEGNTYQRGPLFIHQILLNCVIVAQAYITLYRHRHRIDTPKLLSLAVFPLLPMVGVIIQSIFYGTTMIWSNMTLALLLIFLNVQKSLLLVDSLTGISNRRSVDLMIDSMNERRKDVLYGGMMLDLDNLKEVNDLHGHAAGDRAIKRAAEIIKSTLRKGDFVARYAGDEFFVIIEVQDQDALIKAVDRIRNAFHHFNQTSGEPWAINVSIGYDTFCHESTESVEEAMRRIDELMYQEKKQRKVEQRLVTESAST